MGLFDSIRRVLGGGDTTGSADDETPSDLVDTRDLGASTFRDHASGVGDEVEVLDFSLASLDRFDEAIDAGYDEELVTSEDPATYDTDVVRFGCYLGEVLIRVYGGEWTRDDGWGVTVTGPDGSTTVAVFDVAERSILKGAVFAAVAERAAVEVGLDGETPVPDADESAGTDDAAGAEPEASAGTADDESPATRAEDEPPAAGQSTDVVDAGADGPDAAAADPNASVGSTVGDPPEDATAGTPTDDSTATDESFAADWGTDDGADDADDSEVAADDGADDADDSEVAADDGVADDGPGPELSADDGTADDGSGAADTPSLIDEAEPDDGDQSVPQFEDDSTDDPEPTDSPGPLFDDGSAESDAATDMVGGETATDAGSQTADQSPADTGPSLFEDDQSATDDSGPPAETTESEPASTETTESEWASTETTESESASTESADEDPTAGDGLRATYAAEAEELVSFWTEYDLDYTPESLQRLDALVSAEWDDDRFDDAEFGSDETFDDRVFTSVSTELGSYFGEVLVRALDAEWSDATATDGVVVEGTDGPLAIPVFKVAGTSIRQQPVFARSYDSLLADIDASP